LLATEFIECGLGDIAKSGHACGGGERAVSSDEITALT
jgi:hypothetical protein